MIFNDWYRKNQLKPEKVKIIVSCSATSAQQHELSFSKQYSLLCLIIAV